MFELHTKTSYEEYAKYCKIAASVIGKSDIKQFLRLLIISAFAVVLIITGFYIFLAVWAVFWIAYFTFMHFRKERELRRIWESNHSLHDLEITYKFDEEGFDQISDRSSFRAEYDEIYLLIETQTNFYIMTSLNTGINIRKEECTHEQCLFIREHCGRKGIAKA